MKIFNYLLKLLLCIVYFAITLTFFSSTSTALAQTCGGKPSCTSTTYSESPDGFYCLHNTLNDPFCSSPGTDQVNCNVCNPQTDFNSPYSCRMNPFYGQCASCVDDDQFCSPYNYFEGNVYMDYPYQGTPFFLRCYQDVAIQWVPLQQYGCSSNVEQKFCASGCKTYCDSGTTNCGACGGGFEPANTCGTTGGSQTCQHNQPQTCTNTNFSQGCTYGYNNCSANYVCPGGGGHVDCTTSIIVKVWIDYDHNGTYDAIYPNGVVTINGGNAQTTGSDGKVTYSGLYSGNSYTIAYSDNSPNYVQLGATSQVVNLNNSNGNYVVNFRVTPIYTISGRVYIDYNHDGNKDADEPYYSGAKAMTVSASSGQSDTTATGGTADYQLTNFMSGTYTISLNTGTIPAGYSVSGTTTSKAVTVNNTTGNATGVDFGITPLYTIQGEVCNDTGIDGSCLGSDDQPYSGTNNIQITRATADGTNVGAISQATYQAGVQVLSGTYTVSYSTANGYYFTASKVPGKTVPPYTIAIGQSSYIDAQGHKYTCTTPPAGTSDASCSGGSMNNLNFAISNLESWTQGWCTDLRLEAPSMDVHLPNNGACTDSSSGFSSPNSYAIVCVNNSAGTGVYYGGSNSPTFGYNGGQASSPNYIVSQPYPESFTPVSGVNRASYTYLMDTATSAGITPVDLAGIDANTGVPYCGAGGTADCDFEPNLPDGVYRLFGNLTLDLTNPIPDPGGNKSFVFLVTGKITIKSNILVPSSTSVIFASKGDILVDGSVGQSLTSYASPTPNLEGFYTTESNFIIESNNTTGYPCAAGGLPLDKRLNVLGGVIVGGSVQNQRELCRYDASCPVTTYDTGYTYLLNAPDFAKHKAQLWQETAPSGQ